MPMMLMMTMMVMMLMMMMVMTMIMMMMMMMVMMMMMMMLFFFPTAADKGESVAGLENFEGTVGNRKNAQRTKSPVAADKNLARG